MTVSRPSFPWETDVLSELEALGTNNGVAVDQAAIITEDDISGIYKCTVALASSSTWVFNSSGVYVKVDGSTNITASQTFEGPIELASATTWVNVGNGTGAPSVFLNKADASASVIESRVGGVARWRLECDASEDYNLHRHNSGGSFLDTVWKASASTGDMTFANDIILDSDDPALTVGDGTGNTAVQIKRGTGASDHALVEFFGDAGAGLNRLWFMGLIPDASGNHIELRRRDTDGSAIDTPLRVRYDNGDIEVADNLILNGTYIDMPTGTSDPTGTQGRMYFNTSTDKLRVFTSGVGWVSLN